MVLLCAKNQVIKLRHCNFHSSQGDGDAQELFSDREGPVRFATILKTPYPGVYDEFADERPIIGVVTKKGM